MATTSFLTIIQISHAKKCAITSLVLAKQSDQRIFFGAQPKWRRLQPIQETLNILKWEKWSRHECLNNQRHIKCHLRTHRCLRGNITDFTDRSNSRITNVDQTCKFTCWLLLVDACEVRTSTLLNNDSLQQWTSDAERLKCTTLRAGPHYTPLTCILIYES